VNDKLEIIRGEEEVTYLEELIRHLSEKKLRTTTIIVAYDEIQTERKSEVLPAHDATYEYDLKTRRGSEENSS